MRSLLFWILPALLTLVAGGPRSQAQTLLRWKLRQGETLAVEMTQQTQSQVGFSSKSAETKVSLTMRMAWHVQSADDNEIAVKQTIEHLRASLATATGTAEFDSASKARAAGLTKQLADSMQPLVGAQIDVVFSSRGEVKSAKPANEAAQSLFAAHDQPDAADTAPGSSLAQLVAQSILPLPEKEAAVGDEWTVIREIQSAAGPLVHETIYTLKEVLERDGERLCKIDLQSRLPPSQPAAAQATSGTVPAIRIKNHVQTGTVTFSIDRGRPVDVEKVQKLQTERTYRDTTIEVSLSSSLKMALSRGQ